MKSRLTAVPCCETGASISCFAREKYLDFLKTYSRPLSLKRDMLPSFLIFLSTIAVIALPSGASPGIPFTPRTNFTAPDVFFSNDNWPSDTTGSLSGTVLFAQNQVIPSKIRISGEMRPTLSALRTTLVMFKPSAGVDDKYVLEMRVRAEDGTTVFTKRMDHPNDIRKQVLWTGVDPASLTFSDILSPTISISEQSDLTKLNDPSATSLSQLLVTNANVTIALGDGYWTSNIYLPSVATSSKIKEMNILVRSTAGYSTTVNYPAVDGRNRSVVMSKGVTRHFRSMATASGGAWICASDLIHNSYVFGRFWSATIPHEVVLPGFSLEFAQGTSIGVLSDIFVGAPTELLLHTIDLGFLVTPRNQFLFAKDSTAHREYFQTIPVSRMVVTQYESLHLQEVMLPDGRLLTTSDPSKGGWHEGDMRQHTGKALISIGINNANYGIWSSPGDSERHPYFVAQITAHNSRGKYTNEGVVIHGGSGGAGMVTLEDSLGNEMSHELGHNYEQPLFYYHYPGCAVGSIHRPADQPGSTWGYDSDLNVFIPNFGSAAINTSSCVESQVCTPAGCVDPFKSFPFGFDAMAGGSPQYPSANRFTLYTPYAMRMIQSYFESKAVFAPTSPWGFRIWNPQTKRMENYINNVTALDSVTADSSQAGSPAYLSDLLTTTRADVVRINMRDGGWVAKIVAPAASSKNAGKYLDIDHTATWSSTLTINSGTQRQFSTGQRQQYYSNGSIWLEVSVNLTIPKKPKVFGVPVTTIVGYYDPQQELPSYIFPALHGSFGYLYEDDTTRLIDSKCQVVVLTNNATFRFKVPAARLSTAKAMNKFHVNVAQQQQARRAEVYCNGTLLAARDLEPVRDSTLIYTVNGVPLPSSLTPPTPAPPTSTPLAPVPLTPTPPIPALPTATPVATPTVTLPARSPKAPVCDASSCNNQGLATIITSGSCVCTCLIGFFGATCQNALPVVSATFKIAGTVSTFNSTAFTIAIASDLKTVVSAIAIKGISAGSVVVVTEIRTADATATKASVEAAVVSPTSALRQQAGNLTVTAVITTAAPTQAPTQQPTKTVPQPSAPMTTTTMGPLTSSVSTKKRMSIVVLAVLVVICAW